MRKKVLLSLDVVQLAHIDAAAAAAGKTRSAWIADQLDRALEPDRLARIRRSNAAIAEIRRIFAEADPSPEPFDPVEEIRAMREERLDQIMRAVEGHGAETPR